MYPNKVEISGVKRKWEKFLRLYDFLTLSGTQGFRDVATSVRCWAASDSTAAKRVTHTPDSRLIKSSSRQEMSIFIIKWLQWLLLQVQFPVISPAFLGNSTWLLFPAPFWQVPWSNHTCPWFVPTSMPPEFQHSLCSSWYSCLISVLLHPMLCQTWHLQPKIPYRETERLYTWICSPFIPVWSHGLWRNRYFFILGYRFFSLCSWYIQRPKYFYCCYYVYYYYF